MDSFCIIYLASAAVYAADVYGNALSITGKKRKARGGGGASCSLVRAAAAAVDVSLMPLRRNTIVAAARKVS
jgi:hypothetical protein